MNIIKSLAVIILLVCSIIIAVIKVRRCVVSFREGNTLGHNWIQALLIFVLAIVLICCFGKYTYPFDRTLEPELVSTIHVSPEHSPYRYAREEWHAVYGSYGWKPGTWIHPYEHYMKYSEEIWPEMDLENYTYIITYCQQIESLSYNVWDTIDSPTYTGAYAGYMVLRDEIDPLAIYIYRIPKMRINNPIM